MIADSDILFYQRALVHCPRCGTPVPLLSLELYPGLTAMDDDPDTVHQLVCAKCLARLLEEAVR